MKWINRCPKCGREFEPLKMDQLGCYQHDSELRRELVSEKAMPDDAAKIRRMVNSLGVQYAHLGMSEATEACQNIIEGIDRRSFDQHVTHEEFIANGSDETPWSQQS